MHGQQNIKILSEFFVLCMLKHCQEADRFTGLSAVIFVSGSDAGNGVARGMKTVMALFTAARLISEALVLVKVTYNIMSTVESPLIILDLLCKEHCFYVGHT